MLTSPEDVTMRDVWLWRLAGALRLGLIVLGLLLGTVGFASGAGGEAPPVRAQFDEYIHRLNGAPADPVNLIFLTTDPDTAADAVHRVLGWDMVSGSSMTFVDQGTVRPVAWQMGMQFTRSSRWHMRIEDVTRSGSGAYVLAAVHRDDDAPCGHVGTEFDRARRVVAMAFAGAGYNVTTQHLGNTRPGRQCNGSYTSGDGIAVVIDLTRPPQQG